MLPGRKNKSNRYQIDVELRKFVDFVDEIREIRRRFYSSTENRRVLSQWVCEKILFRDYFFFL